MGYVFSGLCGAAFVLEVKIVCVSHHADPGFYRAKAEYRPAEKSSLELGASGLARDNGMKMMNWQYWLWRAPSALMEEKFY